MNIEKELELRKNIIKISVNSPKGGVGKSTSSLILAYFFAKIANKNVIIVERDPQGTCSLFYQGALKKDKAVFKVVKELSKEDIETANVIIWDHRPEWDMDVLGDIVVVPYQANGESIFPTVKAINEFNKMGKKVLAFANKTKPRLSALEKNVINTFFPERENHKTIIVPERQAYPNAYIKSTTVFDEDCGIPFADKAKDEFYEVIQGILDLYTGKRESDKIEPSKIAEINSPED
ncbi:ParA family protein [Salmonella enterica]|uniref:ParA family protein n=1 Tax=Enterobacter chengduensis TaxID=2494701 RepID=UPI00128A2EAA|nr:ParA family protein [Enterobacter chengduensis]ECI2728802.1 ParA family protein [Salmonella enterica subsp. enterica]ECI4986104.1 ParA family protein [Salmonella enterica subsp. salamae]EHG9724432.1 ParA family protein [Salmonella enterica]EHJ5092558.1 ParA family protein [Salmonella enterica subsp. salamae serovar 16:m,t:-]HBT9007624.1 ParA family protein [Klebsiella pneumoniae]